MGDGLRLQWPACGTPASLPTTRRPAGSSRRAGSTGEAVCRAHCASCLALSCASLRARAAASRTHPHSGLRRGIAQRGLEAARREGGPGAHGALAGTLFRVSWASAGPRRRRGAFTARRGSSTTQTPSGPAWEPFGRVCKGGEAGGPRKTRRGRGERRPRRAMPREESTPSVPRGGLQRWAFRSLQTGSACRLQSHTVPRSTSLRDAHSISINVRPVSIETVGKEARPSVCMASRRDGGRGSTGLVPVPAGARSAYWKGGSSLNSKGGLESIRGPACLPFRAQPRRKTVSRVLAVGKAHRKARATRPLAPPPGANRCLGGGAELRTG